MSSSIATDPPSMGSSIMSGNLAAANHLNLRATSVR